ncbi:MULTISPECIES: flagellar filament capping protein FliD [Proteus]|uniref:flagellar filament capping protein FliD n=1 Tax=Proteus TaxID=583 RepID=UPI000BFD236B|nr:MULTISPECIES: flagellar filament capping protein FliD [Proteus]ATN00195.1 flagellar filament capping protein FliD [Proteus vulgaris]MBG2838795.1 flagellar filament capping protein FliD [Proteus terrae subsp. cibarius]MBG2869809.1 flagellar filament capping protein FliD [Proteus terrae subsp. cibarius]MCS6714480.1 flagellar filament capping protein FliD [Proteus terrae]MCS6733911.1 flagellar filament capping protein FliD [Proteus terrae]
MAGIASLGVGSGMPLSQTLAQLEAAENKRLEPLDKQMKSYEAKITAYGKIRGQLDKLQKASEDLKKFDKIVATKVDDEFDAFKVTTDGKASIGNYTVSIKELAHAQTLKSKAVSDVKVPLGKTLGEGNKRTLVITQPGEEKPLRIELTDDQTSMIELRDAINKKEGNVSATIVKAKDGVNHLVLTSRKEGTESEMTVKVEGDDELNDFISYSSNSKSGAMQEIVKANNAKLTINGIEIERQTNEIKDAPEGIILNLKKKTDDNKDSVDKPEIVTVARDIEPMKKAIQAWTDAYNELNSTYKSLTKYTQVEKGEAASKDNGVLLGDTTSRMIMSELKSFVTSSQGTSDLDTLNKMGIKFKVDGSLDIDSKKLDEALKEKPANVKEFFMGDGKETGFGTQTYNYLKKTLQSNDGTLDVATDGVKKRKKTLDSQIKNTERNIAATMERYKNQFQQLDKMVNSMTNSSASIGRLLM